jgi:hypothetical protein
MRNARYVILCTATDELTPPSRPMRTGLIAEKDSDLKPMISRLLSLAPDVMPGWTKLEIKIERTIGFGGTASLCEASGNVE